MVSDSELVRRLREFLRSSDLSTTTTAAVRRQLEQEFGVDLSGKKAFIREQVDLFLQSQFDDGEGEEGGGEEEEGAQNEENEGVKEEDGESGDGGEEGEEDGQEEEEDGEEGASNGRGSGKKGPSKPPKDVKRKGGGFTKLCSLSPQLQKLVGVSELARTEVVKQLWAYIREHNLQDPANKRKIICDARLHELFNVKTIDMFQMNKALSKHIWPLSSSEDGTCWAMLVILSSNSSFVGKGERNAIGSMKSSEKEKQRKKGREEGEEGSVELRPKEKKQKTGKPGFLAPLQLSDALINFFGTGESALSRADVVKRMWNYIKQNNLQDPTDKRRVICDEKLKELLGVDSFNGFTVPKLLAPHFVKAEQ